MKALPTSVPAPVRRTIELCLRKDSRRRLRDIGDVRLGVGGGLATPVPARPEWNVLLLGAWTLGLALLLAVVVYLIFQRRSASSSPVAPPAVSRFSIATTAAAPLASLGGLD